METVSSAGVFPAGGFMNEPVYRVEVRSLGDVRVFGPTLYEFDTFAFVNAGGAERAALLVKLLSAAYAAGRKSMEEKK